MKDKAVKLYNLLFKFPPIYYPIYIILFTPIPAETDILAS